MQAAEEEPRIRLDENGDINMDRILDADGNPLKNYPLAPNQSDRRADFENALMHAYMTKKAIDEGTEPPPRKYQSEVRSMPNPKSHSVWWPNPCPLTVRS